MAGAYFLFALVCNNYFLSLSPEPVTLCRNPAAPWWARSRKGSVSKDTGGHGDEVHFSIWLTQKALAEG